MKLNLCLLLLGLAAAASVPARAQDATAADTFKNRCAMCHGMDGLAETPAGKIFKAASLKSPMVTDKSNEELHTIIRNGKNKMPPFKTQLSDKQIDAVIGYIRKLHE